MLSLAFIVCVLCDCCQALTYRLRTKTYQSTNRNILNNYKRDISQNIRSDSSLYVFPIPFTSPSMESSIISQSSTKRMTDLTTILCNRNNNKNSYSYSRRRSCLMMASDKSPELSSNGSDSINSPISPEDAPIVQSNSSLVITNSSNSSDSSKRSIFSSFSPYIDGVVKTYNSVVSNGYNYLGFGTKKVSFDKTVTTKVAIIGAGIAGLTCAKELLRNGVKDFVVIDSENSKPIALKTHSSDDGIDRINSYCLL